jgi:predicted RNase H-like HicB family nuclease
MRQARYEIVEDDGSFFGSIPAIPGIWANAKTLEACRDELESVLEGWVLVGAAGHQDNCPQKGPGRSIDECTALAEAHGSGARLDEAYAKDLEEIIASRRPLDTSECGQS